MRAVSATLWRAAHSPSVASGALRSSPSASMLSAVMTGPEDDQDVVAKRHERPVGDDAGGAGRGGRAASSGGDDADAGEASEP
jgi:hypothetical protein